jgi:hypothetical protein
MLISQILLDQFWQGLLHMKGNLVGHISAHYVSSAPDHMSGGTVTHKGYPW